MDKGQALLYQIIFTLDFGIQQITFVDRQEAEYLLDLCNNNQEIIFKHIKFHSTRILTTQLFRKSLLTNKYEPYSFYDFEKKMN